MKIVRIAGGLGNQMFQYAFALYLQQRYPNEKVCIDTHNIRSFIFKKYKGINMHNGYEIASIFPNANIPVATFKELVSITYYIPNYILSRVFRKLLPKRKTEYIASKETGLSYDSNIDLIDGDCYYEGYWQAFRYGNEVRESIYDHFKHKEPNFRNDEYINIIKNTNSLGIHIRRGDYLNYPEYKGICEVDYYIRALNFIFANNESYNIYVFSNDIEWCRTNLSKHIDSKHNVNYVNHNMGKDSCWDLFLMSYCKYLIIANSSFSWWAAFLNKNARVIIRPEKWINRICKIDNCDPNWISL